MDAVWPIILLLRGNEAFEFFEPVLDEVQPCGGGFATALKYEKIATIRRDVVGDPRRVDKVLNFPDLFRRLPF